MADSEESEKERDISEEDDDNSKQDSNETGVDGMANMMAKILQQQIHGHVSPLKV
jgi:hypothetical protein